METINKFMETCKIHVKTGKTLELFFYADQSQSEKVHTKVIKRSNPVEAKELLSSLKTGEKDPLTKRLKTPQDYEEVKKAEPIIAFKKDVSENKKFQKDDKELGSPKFEQLAKENKQLRTDIDKQGELIQALTRLLIDQHNETTNHLSNMQGEVAQMMNTLNGFVRAEIQKKKVTQSSKGNKKNQPTTKTANMKKNQGKGKKKTPSVDKSEGIDEEDLFY